MYSIQHYVIKFVSDLRQVGGFLRALWFPPPIQTDRIDIADILLKVALHTITLTLTNLLSLVDTSANRLLAMKGVTRPVVNVSTLTWFIRLDIFIIEIYSSE